MATYDTSYSSTSLITSIQSGLLCCICPIGSYLITKFGCRSLAIVATMVAAIGLFTSGLSQSIGLLYVTAGALTGIFILV